MFYFQLMDIPTIMETWKTIDGKNFYKTADVCQVRGLGSKNYHPNSISVKYIHKKYKVINKG